jgi:hypothetical protein
MPIRPENKARYPANWKSEVVPRIRARSGNRCECSGQCGKLHTEIAGGRLEGTCGKFNGEPIDDIIGPFIVLTVAHLDHTPENCSDDNLLHMCQGCHNRYDAPHRAAGIKARRHATRALGDLFCEATG